MKKWRIFFICIIFMGMIIGIGYLLNLNSELKKEQQSLAKKEITFEGVHQSVQKEQESLKKERAQFEKDKIAFAQEVNKTKQELNNLRKDLEEAKNVLKETVYHNEMFKDVVVSESEDEFIVTGKAQVFEGVFEYALYNGNKVVLNNHYQTAGAPSWGEFKISFKKELVSGNVSKVELFNYSAKDGSKIGILGIPIIKN